MSEELFVKTVALAKKLHLVCEIAYDYYKETDDNRFIEIALLTGMLVCNAPGCKHRATTVHGHDVFCKTHEPE